MFSKTGGVSCFLPIAKARGLLHDDLDEVCGFRHRDYVTYTYRNGETHTGYVTAMYPELHALNFQSPTKHCKKANALKCRLVWKYSKIYWFKCA